MTSQVKLDDRISERFIAYLRDHLDYPMIGYESPLLRLRGGFETASYRFRLSGVPEELAGPLVLRLYPEFYGTGGAIWESTVQNVLAGEGYPVARAHLSCTDISILGGAFFVMDLLPGEPMITAPFKTIPVMLGKSHAGLHDIDPAPVIEALAEQGIDESRCRLDSRYHWLEEKARRLPWIHDGVDWLVKNRPPEPDRLAVCHDDFHPLNILIQDGEVTGVLDWPGFAVADPALDVANTMVLLTIPYRHLAASVGPPALSSVDWCLFSEQYLGAYRAQKPLDDTHLDYYRVRRCIYALIQGHEGQKAWQHPSIVEDLTDYIRVNTGIEMVLPD
jgi:aminoglycoside phosphotransferase (APT) family kinase protein